MHKPHSFLSFLFILFAWLTSGSAIAADWSAAFNGKVGGNYTVAASTVDASGNIYLVGESNTNITMGSTEVNRIGDRDTFVVKFNAAGTVVWLKNFGGSGAQTFGQSITVDGPDGNVYLGGYFESGDLTTPALTLIGDQDAFAIKLGPTGNTIWAKNFGGSGAFTYGQSITVDGPDGNVYLGGYFESGDLTTPALTLIGEQDAFAIKLDSFGNTTWKKNFGGGGAYVHGKSIAVDGPNGNVYLGGHFMGAGLTTPLLAKIGSRDAFAIKLDVDGTTTWSKRFGGSGAFVSGQSIAVDSDGNVYLGGYFESASLTTPNIPKTGSVTAFAIKLDDAGITTWGIRFGGSGATATYGNSIAVDSTGAYVYLGGYFASGSPTRPALTKIGSQDAFAFKLDAVSGTTIWWKNFGGSGAYAHGKSIAVDGPDGNVYLGGYFYSANLTNPALTKIGGYDAFAIKLDSAGATTLSLNPSGLVAGGVSTVASSTVDSAGNVYVAGYFDLATVTLGGTTLTRIGSLDAFAAKLVFNCVS